MNYILPDVNPIIYTEELYAQIPTMYKYIKKHGSIRKIEYKALKRRHRNDIQWFICYPRKELRSKDTMILKHNAWIKTEDVDKILSGNTLYSFKDMTPGEALKLFENEEK